MENIRKQGTYYPKFSKYPFKIKEFRNLSKAKFQVDFQLELLILKLIFAHIPKHSIRWCVEGN